MSTTITPSGITTPTTYIDRYVLGDREIQSITDSDNEQSTTKLPSSEALWKAIERLDTKIGTVVAGIQDDASGYEVLSKQVVSLTFASIATSPKDGWRIVGWSQPIVNGALTLTNTTGTTPVNSLTVPSQMLTKSKMYLVVVNVVTLSGTLTVKVTNGTTLGRITTPGKHAFVTPINPNYSDEIYLVNSDMRLNELTTIQQIYVGYIRDELTQYVISLINQTLDTFGNGIITNDNANKIIKELLAINLQDMEDHIKDNFNPHHVTASQTGAASLDEFTNLEDAFDGHIEKKNPHGTSFSDVGAAAVDHVHTEYLRKIDLPSLANVKASIPATVTAAPIGNQPSFVAGYHVGQGMPITIYSRHLNHTSRHAYDQHAGILYTNFFPVDYRLVSSHRDNIPRAAIIDNTPEFRATSRKVIYNLHKPRSIYQINIYRDHTNTVVDHPPSVKLMIGTMNYGEFSLNVLNTEVTRIIRLSPVVADTITFELVPNPTAEKISFGFDLEFDDIASGYDYMIPVGVGVNLENDLGIVVIPPIEEALPFNIADTLLEDHDYTVTLVADDNNELSVVVEDLPPVFDGKGCIAMSNAYTSNTHPYFGTLVPSEFARPDDAYTIYSTNAPNVMSMSNTLGIKHTFVQPMKVLAIRLLFDDMDNLPVSMKVVITKEDNTTKTLADGVTTNIASINEIVEKTIDINTTILGFEITLTTTSGKHIVLDTCDVSFDVPSYDTHKHYWTDNVKRIVVGKVTKFGSGYRIVSTALDNNSAIVPINNYDTTSMATVYRIYNPYYTRNINVSIVPINDEASRATIVSCDDQYIHIQTLNKTRLMVRIDRGW